ncbi:MAG: site-specific DNA-methyltransferase [Euryarchaeota archaeon]|nr:site-specific DNA-methyltransferase [Euryarchaeota archaeon]
MPNRSHFNSAHRMMNRLRREGRSHSSAVRWTEPRVTYHLALRSDAAELLRALPTGSVQLAILDPPYNLDIAVWDRFGDYIGWAKEWLSELPRVLSDRGSAAVFGGFQFQAEKRGDLLEIMHFLRHKTPLRLVNLVVWNYSTGMGAHRFFANRHEEIAWFARTDKYFFDLDAVRQKFDKRTLQRYSRDKRLNRDNLLKGKNPGNVWRVERLSANSSERVGHPTQKPSELVSRLVRALSYPGSLVLDPFAGSGVTARVCIEEGRNSVVSDSDPRFPAYLKKQLAMVKEPRCPFVFLKDRGVSEFFKSV